MNAKIAIKINFTGFWSGFDKTNNFFYNLLIKNYKVSISDQPDILFSSDTGAGYIHHNCTKVFYTGENQRPDFMLYDFAFSYDYPVTRKNYRLPLYALYADVTRYINRDIDAKEILAKKTKFCCFVVSNDKCQVRNDFFAALSKYKQVDSGGRCFNNIGGPIENKLEFIKDYKFVIAFENASYPGYTSEKVFEPLQQNGVPIYWGDPLVGNDFNTKSFINCHEYQSFADVIARVIAIDNNDELYMQYLAEPMFSNDTLNEYVKEENILNRLDEIVAFHFNGKFKIRQHIRYPYFKILSTTKSAKQALSYIIKLPARIANKIKNILFKKRSAPNNSEEN